MTLSLDPTPIQKHPRYRVSLTVDLITASGDVEERAAEDISLGGIFVRTPVPPPAGSFVRLRLPIDDEKPVAVMGRVVHVIDRDASIVKAREPGMGVQFDGLSPDTEAKLARFVDALSRQEKRRRAIEHPARFKSGTLIDVPVDRSALARVWSDGLGRGILRAQGTARLGNRVTVVIGPLRLTGDVVAVDDDEVSGGSGTVRLVDLKLAHCEALQRFIEGASPKIEVEGGRERLVQPPPSTSLTMVLADARRLFRGIEEKDPYAAIGLTSRASVDEIHARVGELQMSFHAQYPDASKPQRWRLDEAGRVLEKLGNDLTDRAAEREQLAELVAEADFLSDAGQREEARAVLAEAVELAPDDEALKRRLDALDEALEIERAAQHLDGDREAEALLDGADDLPVAEAIARARRAGQLSSSRTVLLRALRTLANAEADDDALAVAQHLADIDAGDELPHFAMLSIHERAGRVVEAARAGEALLRLRPDDEELRERVQELAGAARTGKLKIS